MIKSHTPHRKNLDTLPGQRMLQVLLALFLSAVIPGTANAAGISSWIQNIGKEVSIIVPIAVVILGAVGVVMAGFGIISAVMAKKNRQPLEYQHWLIVGGVLCVLLIPFVIAIGESISGQDAQDSVRGVLDSRP